MNELMLGIPPKKQRKWTQKTITFIAAFYLTEIEKETMPSGVFSSPIVVSDIYVPSIGDTWIYKDVFLTVIHRHSGAFKKYSRGLRVPPIVFFAKTPESATGEDFRAFLMKTIDETRELD